MNALPIVTRELMVRARLPQLHWTRMTFAALGVLVSLWFFLLWRGTGLSEVGGYAFETFSWMSFLLASAAFVLTADTLSSERRRGTLGLLLLTRVGVADVLAGKLASSGLSAALGLVAIAPVLMLPVLVGGVTWTQVVLVAVSLPGLMFFSLCAGLWASSRSNRLGRSFLRAAVCVVLIVKLPILLGAVLSVAGPSTDWLRSVSPGGAFLWGVGSPATLLASAYWSSVAAGFAWGVLLLLFAQRNLRGNWNEDSAHATVPSEETPALRASVGDGPPVQWLLRRSGLQTKLIWLAVGLIVLPEASSALFSGLQFANVGMTVAFYFVTAVSSSIVLSAVGAMFFLEARRTGALELLRTTPLGYQHVLSDQWAVLKQRFTTPVVAMIFALLIAVLLTWVPRAGAPGTFVRWFPQEVAGVISRLVDLVALCWLGMWFGFSARSAWSALLWPVGLVTGLDFLLSLAIWAVISPLYNSLAYGGVGAGVMISLMIIVPSGLSIAKQVWLIRWARWRLRGALAGAMVEPMELRKSASHAWRWSMAALRKVRHWTPGGGR